MRKNFLFSLFSLLFALNAAAQNNRIIDPQIQTLQVVAGDQWRELPLVRLNGKRTNDVLHISFDDMTHEYRRFTYRIEHCEADWTPSEGLFESDYISGFYDGLTIDDNVESINTQMLYTHYSFQIPNERCQLKMSGNYRLTIMDENDDNREVAQVCFMVLEEQTHVSISVTTNTDIDQNRTHQQIAMAVKYGAIQPTRPQEQIKTVVMQNRCWETAKFNAEWQYNTPQGLEWRHCRQLIFDGGNEFHKFEILDVTHPTMGIDRIEWDGANYHVFPWAVEFTRNYVYNEDANGAFYIRNSDNYENDFSTEYGFVHYALLSEQRLEGDIYVSGGFTNGSYDPQYNLMSYNAAAKRYEAVILQKQGYYNYTFMQQLPDGTIRHLPQDGDSFQTENSYQALVYYRSPTDRADRLVGYGKIQK